MVQVRSAILSAVSHCHHERPISTLPRTTYPRILKHPRRDLTGRLYRNRRAWSRIRWTGWSAVILPIRHGVVAISHASHTRRKRWQGPTSVLDKTGLRVLSAASVLKNTWKSDIVPEEPLQLLVHSTLNTSLGAGGGDRRSTRDRRSPVLPVAWKAHGAASGREAWRNLAKILIRVIMKEAPTED